MLAEVLVYLTTPCPTAHRRLGHLKAAVDLWSRAGRCAAAWAPHYRQCWSVVERAMADLPRRRKVVVLGSGLVRDVPVARLAAAFETVLLVDAVHLSIVRLRLARHRNVVLVTRDLAGLAPDGRPSGDPLAEFAADPDVDLVVSANLLSQIPLAYEDLAAAHTIATLPQPDAIGPVLVAGHLAGLAGFRGRVCLLTDTEQRTVDRAGRVLETVDLIGGHRLPVPDACWTWTLAPFGEDGPEHELVHAVVGYVDFNRALRTSDAA
ncbi:hypothetical protein [Prosthecomicrobium hirschii]|uniref:hypothetical protein n=1 Tax=Prosthecodimorpha hirschii TaxID=665126 RepID=UPI0022204376|nr:hypothetical protein [Prosthecomicrobium hirschii]